MQQTIQLYMYCTSIPVYSMNISDSTRSSTSVLNYYHGVVVSVVGPWGSQLGWDTIIIHPL